MNRFESLSDDVNILKSLPLNPKVNILNTGLFGVYEWEILGRTIKWNNGYSKSGWNSKSGSYYYSIPGYYSLTFNGKTIRIPNRYAIPLTMKLANLL